jgi:hypothetical protein
LAKKIATSRLSRRWALCLSSVFLLAASPRTSFAQIVRYAPAVDSHESYWPRLALGFGASVLAHESAHVVTKQCLFSASGLTTQDLINELILDIPHSKGSAFERGLLAGGIATTLFYISIGRNGAVSDVAFMSRTSSLSKNQLSLIFGGVAGVQAWRVSRDHRYDHFFVRPSGGGVAVGLSY